MDGPESLMRLKTRPHIPYRVWNQLPTIPCPPWPPSRPIMHRQRAKTWRHRQSAALAAGMSLLIPSIARAQPFNCGYGYHPHMWGGGTAGLVGQLFFFVLLVAAMALALLLVRWLGGIGPAKAASPTPLDILKERFARGEIDRQEFDERRQALGE